MGFGGFFGLFGMLLFLGLLALLVYLSFKALEGQEGRKDRDKALETLRLRYAKGELDEETFRLGSSRGSWKDTWHGLFLGEPHR
jgi:putative membrane protein